MAAAFAFLGGLILNLMPCVLPILAMKAIALAQSHASARTARRDGILYFAGVISMFLITASLLLLFRAGGAAIGWGFQLQSPPIVFALTLLMTALGLNLLGVFELPLGIAGFGQGLTQGGGARASFLTGVLAVVVASPCTAPFMGSALGYALSHSAWAGLAVFASLGVGFALPFAAIAWLPSIGRLLPKPGLWMVRLKELLAFPMFATAIWLCWVLVQQVGPNGLAVALSIGLGLTFVIWLAARSRGAVRWSLFGAGVIALSIATSQLASSGKPLIDSAKWRPWSPQLVSEAQQAGRPVFVDFGAAWCVTCLVNERIALQNAGVLSRLENDHVLLLKADWTTRDSAITSALADEGRVGVPLYLLYAPNARRPAVLPQILTPAVVLAALRDIEHFQKK